MSSTYCGTMWFLCADFNLHSITSAVKSSGVVKKRLFEIAYNSKKQAIINGTNRNS